jgi:hypothetical protein
MNRVIGAATTVLAACCLATGCAGSASPAAQPTAIAGAVTQSQAAIPATGATATTTAAAVPTVLTGLSSSELDAAITAATTQATAVHITGTVTAISTPMNLNVQLNKNGTSSGTLGYEGATVPFLVAGGIDYFQVTSSLMALTKTTDTSEKDMWVTSASSLGGSLVAVFGQFMTLNKVIGNGLVGNGEAFTYEGVRQLGSQHIAVYRYSNGQGQSFDYDFPTVGGALALKGSGGDSSTGVNVDFTWNQPTTVDAPPASEIYTGKQ